MRYQAPWQLYSGRGYISQLSTIADPTKPANSSPPTRSCSFTSSFPMTGKMREKKKGNSTSRTMWLCMRPRASLPAEGHVVRVDDDEKIQEAGDDQKRVAVLVRRRAHLARAVPHRARDEIHRADADVGQRREQRERLGRIDGKDREQASANRETNRVHQRQRDQKDEAFAAAAEQIGRAHV